jgi:hypothetical protein
MRADDYERVPTARHAHGGNTYSVPTVCCGSGRDAGSILASGNCSSSPWTNDRRQKTLDVLSPCRSFPYLRNTSRSWQVGIAGAEDGTGAAGFSTMICRHCRCVPMCICRVRHTAFVLVLRRERSVCRKNTLCRATPHRADQSRCPGTLCHDYYHACLHVVFLQSF